MPLKLGVVAPVPAGRVVRLPQRLPRADDERESPLDEDVEERDE
jgi:hypothetical protein